MSIMDTIFAKAKTAKKTIVLPEGDDPRVVKAASQLAAKGIVDVVLLGDKAAIDSLAEGADLSGVTIMNPADSPLEGEMTNTLFELRKAKGMTAEQAKELVTGNPLYFGVMLVKLGKADGMVAGANHSTGDTLRPALQIIKTAPGISTVSSCFLMELPENSPGREYCKEGLMAFGDCAVIPNPTAEEMAAVAVATAASYRSLCGLEPKVAMLSFSTKGSAKHELVTKVQEATRLAKEAAPDLKLDGELQADAALVASVGKLKSPESTVAGEANVLIFPDLQAGNIGYKLVQRLAGAEAIGPIIQGLKQPVNDLSRGCSIEDVVAVSAITAVQAMD